MIGHHPVTIFHRLSDREWKISTVVNCMWCRSAGVRNASAGQVQNDTVTVLLPITPDSEAIEPGDILLPGDHAAGVSSTASRRELLAFAGSMTVQSVTVHCYGSELVRHVEVSGV